MKTDIVILGIFVADVAFRAKRLPKTGETLLADSFHLSPGGKGSNQAVAAARAGARTSFISRLGDDAFASMALSLWRDAGVTPVITTDKTIATGAAGIFLEADTGHNAIIVCPSVASTLTPEDIDPHEDLIAHAKIFMSQLEQPVEAAYRGFELAKKHNRITILNPAPAIDLPSDMLALCDYVTPNETEAEALTGVEVKTIEDAKKAATELCRQGAKTAIVTLGERGALVHNQTISQLIPAFIAGAVVETTGAGDAFNGGFAAALATGMDVLAATKFGCATAALSVTRPGAAGSMPNEAEIHKLLALS